MNKQIQLKASKTNESCLLFNKSNDYSIMGFISIAAIFCLIYFCISGEFECIPYCIAILNAAELKQFLKTEERK